MEVSVLNITTFSSNSSSPPTLPHFSSSFAFVLLVVAMVMGLPGNLLVVWTVVFCLRRRSVTALFILQLATADFLVLLTTPFFLRQLALAGLWEFGESMCKLLHYGTSANMYVSVYLVALMGMYRHLGVARPFLSQRLRIRSRLRPASVAVWALALALATPLLVYRCVRQGVCLLHYPTPNHQVFLYSLEAVAAFLLPFGVMAFCYSRIASKLAVSGRARWRQHSYTKTNRLIGLIVGTFALLWTPYHLFNILQVGALSSGSSPWLLRFCLSSRAVVISLGYLSSAINPLLYVLAGPALSGRAPGKGCLVRLLEATPTVVDVPTTVRRAGPNGIGEGRGSGCGEEPRVQEEMTHVPGKREG